MPEAARATMVLWPPVTHNHTCTKLEYQGTLRLPYTPCSLLCWVNLSIMKEDKLQIPENDTNVHFKCLTHKGKVKQDLFQTKSILVETLELC